MYDRAINRRRRHSSHCAGLRSWLAGLGGRRGGMCYLLPSPPRTFTETRGRRVSARIIIGRPTSAASRTDGRPQQLLSASAARARRIGRLDVGPTTTAFRPPQCVLALWINTQIRTSAVQRAFPAGPRPQEGSLDARCVYNKHLVVDKGLRKLSLIIDGGDNGPETQPSESANHTMKGKISSGRRGRPRPPSPEAVGKPQHV
ncbi:hypothetical protein LSAT2_014966 [Lamellibrachia satsuma]|nr:hypothetical protein LSAT2_014966 [Lamellibrachia satsuma]